MVTELVAPQGLCLSAGTLSALGEVNWGVVISILAMLINLFYNTMKYRAWRQDRNKNKELEDVE